jgi:hypothetical protein
VSALLLAAALLGAPSAHVDSGVLLGLDDGAGDNRRHRTFWISTRNGHVSLVVLKGRLLVPRRDGFWWLSMDPADTEDVPAMWRVGARMPRRRVRPPTAVARDANGHDETGCTEESRYRRVEFVSDRYLAIQEETFSECNWHSNKSVMVQVLRYAPTNGSVGGPPVAASDLIVGADVNELRRAAAAADPDASQPARDVNLNSWSIQRGFGHWRARGAATIHDGSREWRQDFDLPGRLHADGILDPPIKPAWDTILDSVPDAIDAFASPAGGLLVVLTESEVRAYVPTADQLGRPVLRWINHDANHNNLVMAEWAIGRHVKRWDAVVRNALSASHRSRRR